MICPYKLKLSFFAIFPFILTACSDISPRLTEANIQQAKSTSSHLIIFYDSQIGSKPLFEAVSQYQAEILYEYQSLNGIAIRLPADKNPHDAIAYFEKIQGVLGVNQDQVMQLH